MAGAVCGLFFVWRTCKRTPALTGKDERPTQSLEAYDQYQKGRHAYFLRDEGSLRKGIVYFNRAIQLDPGFSRAWSGLADCYSALGYISYEQPDSAFVKAESAAVKAIQLDSTLAEPYTSLGYIKFYYHWDWKGAELTFLTAIRLNPHYVQAFDSYGYYLTAMGRFPEARQAFQKALELDPLSPAVATDMGFNLYYSRSYTQAVSTLRSALEINRRSPLAHLWLGRSYQEQKRYKEAIEEYTHTLNGIKDWPVALAAIGYVYGISGQKVMAEKTLADMKTLARSKYVTPYGIALIYASLNEKDQAFEWLNKAYEERSNWLVWLKLDPRWAPVSHDKRYDALVKKIGLP